MLTQLCFLERYVMWDRQSGQERTTEARLQIVTNVVVQIIIFLYLIDNNEQTSWMILMGNGVGILIEAWKASYGTVGHTHIRLTASSRSLKPWTSVSFLPLQVHGCHTRSISKVRPVGMRSVDIGLTPVPSPRQARPERRREENAGVSSDDQAGIALGLTQTCRYDKLAFRYVAYVTIPCLAAYTVYSLIYETHRGWYSFVISTLTSFVYMFGFVSPSNGWCFQYQGLTCYPRRRNWFPN